MISKVFVVPAEGLMIPDIDSGRGHYIPAEGALVERTIYIERRLRVGDLKEVIPPEGTPDKAAAVETGVQSQVEVSAARVKHKRTE